MRKYLCAQNRLRQGQGERAPICEIWLNALSSTYSAQSTLVTWCLTQNPEHISLLRWADCARIGPTQLQRRRHTASVTDRTVCGNRCLVDNRHEQSTAVTACCAHNLEHISSGLGSAAKRMRQTQSFWTCSKRVAQRVSAHSLCAPSCAVTHASLDDTSGTSFSQTASFQRS